MATVERLSDDRLDGQQAWFCASPDCHVVYFDTDGRALETEALRVQVFQKERDLDRPVCYCFEHTVADVLAASADDGSNRIVDAITQACRAGLDRCEQSNPQGRCCLGNVRGLLGSTAPCCES